MTDVPSHETLEQGRKRASISMGDLWMSYFELGGDASPLEVEAILLGLLVPTRLQYDILAHAINERLMDIGNDVRVPYATTAAEDDSGPHEVR